jgi:nicotinamide-nucleotide amidase
LPISWLLIHLMPTALRTPVAYIFCSGAIGVHFNNARAYFFFLDACITTAANANIYFPFVLRQAPCEVPSAVFIIEPVIGMEKVFASIITIGDELLIGQVVDTNSSWMAQELNKMGILVKHRVAVGDVWDDIWAALDEESRKASLVLITGGLGPTADDITKQLLCDYFGGKMVVHQPTLEHITRIFQKLQRPMIDRNAKQAEVPDVCTVLKNERGTAPGMLFKKDNKVFVSLPGVPHEMKWLMEHQVLPLIPELFQTGFVEHRTLLTAGIGESFLADLIEDLEKACPRM